jgi:magnesium-transporting ATPase (P-type)
MSHTVQMPDFAEMHALDFDWHSKTVEEVVQLQETSIIEGLSTAEAAKRLEAYGKNELPAPAKTPFYVRLWNQLNNILIFILIGAIIVCAILEEWAEVALVIGVIVINVSIGLVQEGKAEAAADAIKGMLSSNATVVRNGEQTSIPAVPVLTFSPANSGNRV